MTRETLISAAQELADAGGLKLATLEFTTADVVKVVPTPAPLPALTIASFTAGKLQLRYPYPGATTRLWKDGSKMAITDTNGDISNIAHSAAATYQVKSDADGRDVTQPLSVLADGTIGIEPPVTPPVEPPDQPPPPIIDVTDPTIPPDAIRIGAGHAITTLSSLNSKQQAGKSYLFEPGEYKFSTGTGLSVKLDGTSFYGEPDKVILRSTGTDDFPKCIDVYGKDHRFFGLRLAGKGKSDGFKLNSATNIEIAKCGAVNGDLGTFIDSGGVTNLNWHDCNVGDCRRYTGMYGKVTGGIFKNLTLGKSLGGTWEGATFAPEHGIRLEWYAGIVQIINLISAVGKKSDLNVKRRLNDSDKLTVTGSKITRAGLGPLGDTDGLQHKDDPAYILTGVTLQDVIASIELRLEMNCEGLIVNGGSYGHVAIENDPRYAPWRKLASATFTSCNVGSWAGPKTRITVK